MIEKVKNDYEIELTSIPCESKPNTLVEGEPLKGAKKFAIKAVLNQIQASGKNYGLYFKDFEFEANSRNALLIQLLANEKGLGEAYSLATYKAFFEHGKNIGLRSIVQEIAIKVGLKEADIISVLESDTYNTKLDDNMLTAKSNGVKKFPTFVINDTHMIEGSPNEKKLRTLLSSI